jgi:HD-GYP domain-containing protein (c-di-GMP phosphodiesterase class II)
LQAEITPELERVLEASLARRRGQLVSREAFVEAVFAIAFAVAALVLALTGAHAGASGDPLWLIAAFVIAYALVASAQFDTGAGYVTAVSVLLIPMLLLLEAAYVPLLVALALVLKATLRLSRGQVSAQRVLNAFGDSWYAFFGALVIVVADPGPPAWEDWPVYVAAVAAQIAGDAVISSGRAWGGLGIHPRNISGELFEAYKMDVLLAPVGVLAAIAAADEPAGALLVLPLVALFAFFAGEREARIEQTLELSRAYRGTALLLGDVIEDDDEYTGQHTKGVVLLSTMVADELGVSETVRREVEFGALLHDVGKIAIPKAIINKPGPLDDQEWAIMKTHTVEGEKLLSRVGGILTRVGVVVRASHERFDGRGYPDGLSGEDIPLSARIVSACDAYNAMTTDRAYRAALGVEVALAELRSNAGTQFDPQVVEALCGLVERWDPEMARGVDPTEDVDTALRKLLAEPEE